ncbi:OX-2 membrane glycoprotein-like isoform X2 [Gambusia affinis]|uniref:OX-2 membrane glycoprotein-like isoform X2 n=1 Tax=Gambusia affinis TaxID=33528 RepID=UPI001CDD0096|nr:OX-2 membrane glycoprotein-like isoform X2 [Gambusia affinis]XP_043965706.1 OX-2 membrane glycoprotein-like isoform X2 [Gambusia affinis]
MDSCISFSFILIRTYAMIMSLLFRHTAFNRFLVCEVSCYALFVDSVFLFPARASLISLHGTTAVEYGGEANFNCKLPNPKGVLQVTWQRGLRPQSLENMATYNKPVGEQINEPFKGKVILSNSSLSSSSITLKNVTWADENCYVCSFNVYPDGSQRKQICLKVEGISETHKRNSSASSSAPNNRKEELSCSATGKPAPKISWDTSDLPRTDSPQLTKVSNSDGTFTISSNITVEMPTNWRGLVFCVINQGLRGERQEEFHFSSLEKEEEEGNVSQKALIIAVLAVIICVTVVAVVFIHKSRLKRTCNDFTAV